MGKQLRFNWRGDVELGYEMTEEEMMLWLDTATYPQLLRRWRFESLGSNWFQGEVGSYFVAVMSEKKQALTVEDQVKISREIGFRGC